jgi:hypothetical protein
MQTERSGHPFHRNVGAAATAAISAFDFGGVAVPHRLSVGAGGGVSKAWKLCRSGNGSSAPVTKATDAKRAPGYRPNARLEATDCGVTSSAFA